MKDKPLTCREIIFIQLKMLLGPNVGDHMNILGLIMEQFTVSSFSPKDKFTHCLRVFETKHLMLILKARKISILSEEFGRNFIFETFDHSASIAACRNIP